LGTAILLMRLQAHRGAAAGCVFQQAAADGETTGLLDLTLGVERLKTYDAFQVATAMPGQRRPIYGWFTQTPANHD